MKSESYRAEKNKEKSIFGVNGLEYYKTDKRNPQLQGPLQITVK